MPLPRIIATMTGGTSKTKPVKKNSKSKGKGKK